MISVAYKAANIVFFSHSEVIRRQIFECEGDFWDASTDIGGSIVCLFGNMSNETSQFSFFRLSEQAGPEKRLYFVSRFIVLFCPAFIFRKKESDLEVNIPGALQGGEF